MRELLHPAMNCNNKGCGCFGRCAEIILNIDKYYCEDRLVETKQNKMKDEIECSKVEIMSPYDVHYLDDPNYGFSSVGQAVDRALELAEKLGRDVTVSHTTYYDSGDYRSVLLAKIKGRPIKDRRPDGTLKTKRQEK